MKGHSLHFFWLKTERKPDGQGILLVALENPAFFKGVRKQLRSQASIGLPGRFQHLFQFRIGPVELDSFLFSFFNVLLAVFFGAIGVALDD